jgi:hypothetical protein
LSLSSKTGKGNPCLKGTLGEATTAAAKTNSFLGQRWRRLVKRRGKLKALVVVRSVGSLTLADRRGLPCATTILTLLRKNIDDRVCQLDLAG